MKLASGVAPVVAARRVGIAVGLGTDGVAGSNNDLDMWEAMDFAGKLAKVSPSDPTVLARAGPPSDGDDRGRTGDEAGRPDRVPRSRKARGPRRGRSRPGRDAPGVGPVLDPRLRRQGERRLADDGRGTRPVGRHAGEDAGRGEGHPGLRTRWRKKIAASLAAPARPRNEPVRPDDRQEARRPGARRRGDRRLRRRRDLRLHLGRAGGRVPHGRLHPRDDDAGDGRAHVRDDALGRDLGPLPPRLRRGQALDGRRRGQGHARPRAPPRGRRRQGGDDVGPRPRPHGRHARQARGDPGVPDGPPEGRLRPAARHGRLRAHRPDGFHRAGRPAALRAAGRDGHGRVDSAHHGLDPLEEARDRRARGGLRREDGQRRLHGRSEGRRAARKGARRHDTGDGPQGLGLPHRDGPAHRRGRRERERGRGVDPDARGRGPRGPAREHAPPRRSTSCSPRVSRRARRMPGGA